MQWTLDIWTVKISAKYLGIEDICLDKLDYLCITIKENVDHKSTFTCGVSSLKRIRESI